MSEPRSKRATDSERRARQPRGGPPQGKPSRGGSRRQPGGPARDPRRPRREGDADFADDASTAAHGEGQGRRRPGERGRRRVRPRSGAPKPNSSSPKKAKKAFEIRRGEYYKGPADEDELEPLDQVTLPKSILQEDEEKDFRRRFGKKSDDEIVNIYEQHSAVTISSSAEEEIAKRKGRAVIWIFFLLLFISAILGAAYAFRADLQPYLSEYGIELPE